MVTGGDPSLYSMNIHIIERLKYRLLKLFINITMEDDREMPSAPKFDLVIPPNTVRSRRRTILRRHEDGPSLQDFVRRMLVRVKVKGYGLNAIDLVNTSIVEMAFARQPHVKTDAPYDTITQSTYMFEEASE